MNGLEKVVASNKLPVLFVGSGISRRYLYNYPDWEELLTKSFKAFDPDPFKFESKRDELRRQNLTDFEINSKLGSYAEDGYNKAFFERKIKLGKNRNPSWVKHGVSPYKMFLSKTFKKMNVIRNKNLRREIDLFKQLKNKVAAVITTNYDQFLETEIFNSDYSVFIDQSDLFSADSYNIAEIYKIHGCVSKAESIVITESDYENFNQSRKLIIAKMLTLFTESPLIFLGYSLTDENVRKIITDFLSCLNNSQRENISEHFIFISYKDGIKELQESKTNIMTGNGTYIPITEIKTGNFKLIFDTLNKIVPGISPTRIRQTKRIVKRIVDESIAADDAESYIVGLEQLDDMDLSSMPLAIAVGNREIIKEAASSIYGKSGYSMLTVVDIIEDVLFDNHKLDPTMMCSERFASISYNHIIPIFKYIKLANFDLSNNYYLNASVEAHNSREKILSAKIIKSLKTVPDVSDFQELQSAIKNIEDFNKKAGLLLKNISIFTSKEIRQICCDLFKISTPSEIHSSTNYKRCVLYLDFIENYE